MAPAAIHLIRGQRVILAADLAALYGVPTKRLNEQVRRNAERFPADFMFRLTRREFEILRSQSATSSSAHGGSRRPPLAFTEHGAIMAAGVLNSECAIRVSIEVVRMFIRLREAVVGHADLARRLDALEAKYDASFKVVFDAIRRLMEPPDAPKPRIGFQF